MPYSMRRSIFFFQAEDGIRDPLVTGVQTCALPICTEQFRKADANHRLITIPTGDGMALVFYNTPEAPVECALEISRAVREHPELKLRMGVHSGAVSGIIDVSGRANIAGAGINVAQRVMDCGDTGHILLSKHVAEDLEQLGHWHRTLHDLGEPDVRE